MPHPLDEGSTEHQAASQLRRKSISTVDIGERLYQWRDYLAIPICFMLVFVAEPKVAVAAIGTLIIVLGLILRVYTRAFMQSAELDSLRSTIDTEAFADIFFIDGPFGVIRNPLYFSYFLMIFGILIFAGVVWFSILGIAFFGFLFYHIVKYEEEILGEKFGDEYKMYLEKVPAWIPFRVPQTADFPMPKSIWPAVKQEQKVFAIMGIILFVLILLSH